MIEAQAFSTLILKNPAAHVTEAVWRLTDVDFRAQKAKHLSQHALGGAIGIIGTPDGDIVLVKRTGMHAGWALPGGTVEHGEDFATAFEREVKEEVGVAVRDVQLAAVEKKQFLSPANEKLNFLLAVFTAQIGERLLPATTNSAQAEGLTVALFPLNRLPAAMIMSDRQKISTYCRNSWTARFRTGDQGDRLRIGRPPRLRSRR